jgi:hypothetical protein
LLGPCVHKVEDSSRRKSLKGGKTAAAHESTQAVAGVYLK